MLVMTSPTRRLEVAKSLLDISVSVKEAAAGLMADVPAPSAMEESKLRGLIISGAFSLCYKAPYL